MQINVQYDKPETDDDEVRPIRWANIIFLPFQSTWKFLVLLVVISKCVFGPLSSIYSIHCTGYMDNNFYLYYIKRFYAYICEPIYVIDTSLYIIHRQVTEEAMRREFLPKSGFLLLLDVLAVVPFFRFLTSELCPPAQIWPNILSFNELLIIYRIVEYFELTRTHTVWKIIVGYAIMLLLYVNSLTCFFLLLTFEGLCGHCHDGIYDWRAFLLDKFNKTNEVTQYLYASALVLAMTVHKLLDETKPSTYLEFVFCIVVLVFGYLLLIFVMLPKLFAEGVLNIRHICTFHPRVNRIIEETKRRNPFPGAHRSVESFYALIWSKSNGLTDMPKVITELPFYLKLNITQDLVWPVFFHSPTFRKTSISYKRWLCEHIHYDYKLPGEKFFAGLHCHSNLYYIKSGIVQLISPEDKASPMLSVTSGTLFGDISFFVPQNKRKVDVRCLTYCEVYSIPRSSIIISLFKFPEDGRNIIGSVKARIKHANTLYTCKNNIRGLDRSEDEGISWVKRRWWEINDAINLNRKSTLSQLIPLEEANYHCAKFIGQLVLASNVELQRKSLFVKVKFPWVLAPHSTFNDIWHRVVLVTVYIVLFVLPPVIATSHTREEISKWFAYFHFYIDFIYTADVFVYLMTAVERKGSLETRFIMILFERCKQVFFVLDILSTAWIENFVSIIGHSEYYYVCQYNRLIKTYMLYFDKYKSVWQKDKDPMDQVIYAIALTQFYFGYVLGFVMFSVVRFAPNLTPHYFYGDICNPDSDDPCEGVLEILSGWLFQMMFPEHEPITFLDCFVGMIIIIVFFLMHLYTKAKFTSCLYVKYREIINYYFFVRNLKKHYIRHRTHPHLLLRLDRYLICHWKYYKGMDILHPKMLKELPYDIYYKFHGQLAEKIIAESPAFKFANPGLIRELAHKADFLILPQQSTLMAFGVYAKNVMWIANGTVECQYFTDEGESLRKFLTAGTLLTFSAVFLKRTSLRHYTAATEIEILYIKLPEFFSIFKRYPNEYSYIESCMLEFNPQFDRSYQIYLKKNQNRQKKLRDSVAFVFIEPLDKKSKKTGIKKILNFFTNYRTNPESGLIRLWMKFRVAMVMISIVSSALQGGRGAMIRPYLMTIGYFCDVVGYTDIIIKMFVPFYDARGLVISDVRNCMIHYLTRGFLMDVIGTLPWDYILKEVADDVGQNDICLLRTSFKFCHVYILMGFFDYLCDLPTVNMPSIMIIKWQIVTLLFMFGTSIFLIDKCIEFKWNNNYELIQMERRNSCWYPNYMKLHFNPTIEQLHNVFVESLNLAQCGLLMINLGKFHVLKKDRLALSICFLIVGAMFWYINCYCETLLILHFRGNTLFQHGVRQLNKFLTAERVTPQLITRAMNHFIYVWIRTKGVNIQTLMNERIGAVFRQDLSYFFFKNTLSSVGTLLGGGESLERSLASNVFQIHFLPDEDIIREMQLSHSIFIVHRGKVILSKKGEKLATLKKGSIFGQLEGTVVRPVAVTAQSVEHTDLLHISIKQFQDVITNDVRENIRDNPQSRYDFMAVKKSCPENPYNSIEYILRERKTIKLPWMRAPVSPENNLLYSRWLFCVWLCGPMTSAVLALLIEALPDASRTFITRGLIALDILHLVHLISEGFTMEVRVIDDKCVKKYIRLRTLFSCWYILDILSLLVPLLTIVTADTHYQLARLLRIHSVCSYQRHFCRNFQTRYAPVLVKFVMVLLLLHAFTCGWIIVACNSLKHSGFPVEIPKLPYNISLTVNPDEWIHPNLRRDGCPRITPVFLVDDTQMISFLVPIEWYADYIVALAYIVITQTRTNMDIVVPLTEVQMYYKVVTTVILYLIEMWITCVCISSIYTRLREMYYYDYHVINLITYMKQNGLSTILLQSLRRYTKLLWQRQRGNWLPEITQLAPTCLREDILSALYMHHLEAVPEFKQLPIYFLRQLVARLNRVVVFPGNNIVLEGDILPCMYFIHEGEVEKWYTDRSGEPRLSVILSINGYFGLIPGLFPNSPYKYSYYTRTVVDLVYLRYYDWLDLLNSYPDIKNELYIAVAKLKNTY